MKLLILAFVLLLALFAPAILISLVIYVMDYWHIRIVSEEELQEESREGCVKVK